MSTETAAMQDHSTCCDGRIEMTNERIFGIALQYPDSPLTDGYNSSRELKRYILL